jgi:hypothetical protein
MESLREQMFGLMTALATGVGKEKGRLGLGRMVGGF